MLYRVALPGGKRCWMVPLATTGLFSSPSTTRKLQLVRDEEALFANPRKYLQQQATTKDDDKDVHEVHYSQLLAPIAGDLPPLVLGIGLNYVAHSEETKTAIPANRDEQRYPIVFGKSPRSVIGPGSAIEIPRVCSKDETDFEVELAVVIGRECKNATRETAMDHVLGFTCANDVSARKWQGKFRGGGQWSKAKSFDTFCPLGPGLFVGAPPAFSLSSRIKKKHAGADGGFAAMQTGSSADMVFDVPALVEFLSQDATLPKWTVILTGTPAGVGYTRKPQPVVLEPGDEIECAIQQIGALWNPVTSSGGGI